MIPGEIASGASGGCRTPESTATLQWGRGRAVTEFALRRRAILRVPLLQWGRDPATTEFDKGVAIMAGCLRLQWLRDRGISRLQRARWFSKNVLQWGRDRGIGVRLVAGQPRYLASMGPRSRNWRIALSRKASGAGFNGAVIARSRNFLDSCNSQKSCLASMGP